MSTGQVTLERAIAFGVSVRGTLDPRETGGTLHAWPAVCQRERRVTRQSHESSGRLETEAGRRRRRVHGEREAIAPNTLTGKAFWVIVP